MHKKFVPHNFESHAIVEAEAEYFNPIQTGGVAFEALLNFKVE